MLPAKDVMQKIVTHLQKVMRIQDVDIDLQYVDQYHMKHLYGEDHFDTIMLCMRYRLRKEATIYINVDHPDCQDDWYSCIVHELFHVINWEFPDMIDDLLDEIDAGEFLRRRKKEIEESTVSRLEKIFVNLYPLSNLLSEVMSDAVQVGGPKEVLQCQPQKA